MSANSIDKAVISLVSDLDGFTEDQKRSLEELVTNLQAAFDELSDRVNDIVDDYNAHTTHPP